MPPTAGNTIVAPSAVIEGSGTGAGVIAHRSKPFQKQNTEGANLAYGNDSLPKKQLQKQKGDVKTMHPIVNHFNKILMKLI